MGCDIHAYVEYMRPSERAYWASFGQRINPGRNYAVFANLAGVRGDVVPVAAPRGLPETLGFYSSDDSKMFIVEGETDSENCVTRAKAERWVQSGASTYVDHDGRHVYVTHPDWHSHSWVTVDEWDEAIKRAEAEWPAQADYHALTAAMRELERRGLTVRVVFWFDN